MAELTTAEKLQPSLLDRLRDDEPGTLSESRASRVISSKRLRDYAIRDLAWLLNTAKMSIHQDLSPWPQVETSVLNFGVSGLSGVSVSRDNIRPLEAEVKNAIINYEPRIDAKSLAVKVFFDTEELGRNAMVFEIEGELWGNPIPTSLFLKTEFDLETGNVNVKQS
ncbi:MAG: type VI secretion system protein ImpF [Oleiphilaceae bacterium]|jgi:type VI secretion system protein ImpF